MPISRVRRLALYAAIPYTPSAARNAPTAPTNAASEAATRKGKSVNAVICARVPAWTSGMSGSISRITVRTCGTRLGREGRIRIHMIGS